MMDSAAYNLSPAFERAILFHLVFSQKFWHSVGTAMEPDAFSTDVYRLIASTAFAVNRETSTAAGGTIVIQRLTRMLTEGRVTYEQILECDDALEDLECEDHPDVDAVINEFLPIVKERRNRTALHMAMQRMANREDLDDVIDHMQETVGLGESRSVGGIDINLDTLSKLKQCQVKDRLPTGIGLLDQALKGGPSRGTLSVVMGDSGDGKSMCLTHVTGTAITSGINTLVATLELSVDLWSRRLLANLTGIGIHDLHNPSMYDMCNERLAQMHLGQCRVEQFTASVTTVPDILRWAKDVERDAGWTAELLVVDYADLLGHSRKRDYEGMREVYGSLRENWAVERDGWVWTGSQARRRQKSSDKAGKADAADSQNKIRISDVWLVLNAVEDGAEVEYYLAKNRGGRAGMRSTYPTDWECARMVPQATYDAPNDAAGNIDMDL